MLRITVCMHNVPGEDIFCLTARNAFGMDKDGADYYACATYGTMYKKLFLTPKHMSFGAQIRSCYI